LYLRAFLQNIGTNLGDEFELDSFLRGAMQGEKLHVAMQEECDSTVPRIQSIYRNSNILQTINQWLVQLHLNDVPPQSIDQQSRVRQLQSSSHTSQLTRPRSNINILDISLADPLASLDAPGHYSCKFCNHISDTKLFYQGAVLIKLFHSKSMS